MKCYNHHDRDAFGICKICGKGLCLECLKEEKGVIVCKSGKCLDFSQNIIIGLVIVAIMFIIMFLKILVF